MKALVTGGAGFIGTNLILALCGRGWKVTLFDNLSRKGAGINLKYLKGKFNSNKLQIVIKDIRDFKSLKDCVGVDVVFHLAAQTAVTTSIENPREDFEANALGTFNLLEAVRQKNKKAIVLFASTNKVYGGLSYLKYKESKSKYCIQGYPDGIDESFNLDFNSPYGCSKGVADQYVRDYARIYNLSTVVFRQSCIYGPMQFGIEDQGWVAHLGARAILGKPVSIFGNGKQVRDLLYIDDLVEAYLKSIGKISKVKGEVFNIGGGAVNSLSILQYVNYLEDKLRKKIKVVAKKTRTGDQKVFISDNTKIKKYLNWTPATGNREGLPKMLAWIKEKKGLFAKI